MQISCSVCVSFGLCFILFPALSCFLRRGKVLYFLCLLCKCGPATRAHSLFLRGPGSHHFVDVSTATTTTVVTNIHTYTHSHKSQWSKNNHHQHHNHDCFHFALCI
uniref:(northern house mosquito) hypothetical protein n=1 Tax=Culex pipiens TaxID=7175 RepID=A0A8D8C9N1_CULPI